MRGKAKTLRECPICKKRYGNLGAHMRRHMPKDRVYVKHQVGISEEAYRALCHVRNSIEETFSTRLSSFGETILILSNFWDSALKLAKEQGIVRVDKLEALVEKPYLKGMIQRFMEMLEGKGRQIS